MDIQQWYAVGTNATVFPRHTLTTLWAGGATSAKGAPQAWLSGHLRDEFTDMGVCELDTPVLEPLTDEVDGAVLTADAKRAFVDAWHAANEEGVLPVGLYGDGKPFQVPFEFAEDGESALWWKVHEADKGGNAIGIIAGIAGDLLDRMAGNRRVPVGGAITNCMYSIRPKVHPCQSGHCVAREDGGGSGRCSTSRPARRGRTSRTSC